MIRTNQITAIVFWETALSPHTEHFINSVRLEFPECIVRRIAVDALLPERRELGLSLSNVNHLDTILIKDFEHALSLLESMDRCTLHVFGGIRGSRILWRLAKFASKQGLLFAIMSEAREVGGVLGKLRLVQSWFSERRIKHQVLCVFAIGASGVNWYRRVGYPIEKIYPFGYFIDSESVNSSLNLINSSMVVSSEINVAYVGRLERSKGIHHFLKIAEEFSDRFNFFVVGDGSYRNRVKFVCDHFSNRIRYKGKLKQHEVRRFFKTVDILVVPSIVKDGWAVVVSEALLNGVFVIACDRVGSTILFDHYPNLGTVVKSDNAYNATARALHDAEMNIAELRATRAARQAHAERLLTCDVGARYFKSIVYNINRNNANQTLYWP